MHRDRLYRKGPLVIALLLVVSAGSHAQIGQQLGQIRYNSGQNVVPVYEGWEKNPDGTFNLVFGYMNRNYKEEPEIPIGANNSFSPGPADQGQPTHFYPRRQQFMFKVKVPADFGRKELLWTLTRNGQTEKAYGTLLMEEQLTDVVISENRGGLGNDSVTAKPNQPPKISIDGAGTRTAAVGEPVSLTASASDDGIPTPPPARGRGGPPVAVVDGVPLQTTRERPTTQAIVKPSREGLAVTWTQWRGPGTLTFDPMTVVVKDGKASTRVTFTEPGTYVIRAYADDGVLAVPADVTINVTGKATR
ncbi:MAG: hypothetical protein DMF89_17200 [Acidobacteria bacterium]|nr:MAG: hypothetical protein DMF90_03090 [Acidobacteriota bacterium]PYR47995.1 MAG: hypothetical protein DMF89_17200 [Acidobacteriota bacterium]